MSHRAVGLDGVAKGGLRGEPVEEGEERERVERERVVVEEIDHMVGSEGREEPPERRGERLCLGVVDGCGDGGEKIVGVRRRRRRRRVPGGVSEGRFGRKTREGIGEFEFGTAHYTNKFFFAENAFPFNSHFQISHFSF